MLELTFAQRRKLLINFKNLFFAMQHY